MPELKTATVEHGPYRITIREATALEEARHERLVGGAYQEDDRDRFVARLMYADLCAAAIEAEGMEWPLPFDEYLQLPGTLVSQWKAAVMEVNPYWFAVQMPAEEKKHQIPSIEGS